MILFKAVVYSKNNHTAPDGFGRLVTVPSESALHGLSLGY